LVVVGQHHAILARRHGLSCPVRVHATSAGAATGPDYGDQLDVPCDATRLHAPAARTATGLHATTTGARAATSLHATAALSATRPDHGDGHHATGLHAPATCAATGLHAPAAGAATRLHATSAGAGPRPRDAYRTLPTRNGLQRPI
jgi:hypothetical protein